MKTVLDCISSIALNIWLVIPVAVTEYLVKIWREQKKFKKQDDEERLNNWKGGQ